MSDGDLSDPRDYVLDLNTNPASAIGAAETAGQTAGGVPRFLSIHFKCCRVYAAIYRVADGTKFAGHCPKCRRAVEIGIGPGGSTSRVFQAG